MLKIHSTYSFVTVPSKVLKDEALSLESKALYLLIWTTDPDNFSLDNIAIQTSSTIETIHKAYDELINSGYLTIKDGDVNIWAAQQKVTRINQEEIPFDTSAEVKQKKKKPNKWDQIEKLIEDYTEDKDLRYVLKGYFLARMTPDSASRFSIQGPIQVYQVKQMLEQLDTCSGDKIKIVEYCKEREYMRFFDIKQSKSTKFENVKSESITPEEMDVARKRWAEMEAQGMQYKY